MSERTERDRRPPSGDVDHPSAVVLDELLRAFSADPTDTERLASIDLTSPEVAELLDPSPPPPDREHEPDAEVDVGVEADVEVDVEAVASSAIDPLLQPEPVAPAPAPEPAGGTTIVIDTDDGSNTVFIDDTGSGARADATSAARIEPRFRDRRIAVRRSQGRRRLRWVILATVVIVLVVGALAVLGSSWFAISSVEVEGLTYSDRGAVDAVVEDLLGTPVLRADTDRAEERLEAIPWVEEAVVSTDFPDGAKIEISEREPVAAFQGPDDQFRVIDRHGRVLDVVDGQPVAYLRVESPDAPAAQPGAFTPSGFAAAASLVDALTPTMRSRAESVFVTADGADLRLQLVGGTEVRFGRGDDLINKLVRLETVLSDEAVVRPSLIDVSTPQVVVR